MNKELKKTSKKLQNLEKHAEKYQRVKPVKKSGVVIHH